MDVAQTAHKAPVPVVQALHKSFSSSRLLYSELTKWKNLSPDPNIYL